MASSGEALKYEEVIRSLKLGKVTFLQFLASDDLGGRIKDCGLKQPQRGLESDLRSRPQTASEVGFEVTASEVIEAAASNSLKWGALKCEEVIIHQTV